MWGDSAKKILIIILPNKYCFVLFYNNNYIHCIHGIFLKNQTRPITNLARAAEKFGRGEEIEEYKPSGAAEIRQAGYEFDKMRKRIGQSIECA